VAAHAAVFPYAKAISWIVRHAELETRYIINSKEHPIASFEASIITSCYHLENRERSSNEKLIRKFLHDQKELLKAWYKPDKKFKSRPSGEYPTTCRKRHINMQWSCCANYIRSMMLKDSQ
jgi:hypothetical protein